MTCKPAALVALRVGLLLPGVMGVAQAQPAPRQQWVRYVGESRAYEYANGSLRLSTARYVSAGQRDPNNGTGQAAYLAFTRPDGRAISQHLFPLANHSSTSFSGIAPAGQGSFYTIGYGFRSRGGLDHYLSKFDSVGTLLWRRSYRRDSIGRQDYSIISAPRGGYTAAYKIYSAARWHAEVTRFDERGRMRWVKRLGNFSYAYRMAPLPDGSYVVASTDYTRIPSPVYNYKDAGIKLYKLSPAGDSLTSVWLNYSGYHDVTLGLTPTRDGGLLVTGYGELTYGDLPRALCIKLDSTWREEWRHTLDVGSFFQAQELANGHFVLSGTTLPPFYLTELIPPTRATPADTLPSVAWRLTGQPVLGTTMFCEPGGIRLMGEAVGPTPGGSDLGIAYYTGLTSAPVSAEMCARPPVFGQPPTAGALTGSTLTFTLDSAATLAGPRYGEVSLVAWDFGDGSPPDTGWVVRHAFASPAPVRVRVCATNNLFCQTCTTLEPFGPTGLAPGAVAAAVSVYPNPSSSGWFTVRTPDGGVAGDRGTTFAVTDALGRLVVLGTLTGADTALDLSCQPTGVYILRLTWPEGRSSTHRLLR